MLLNRLLQPRATRTRPTANAQGAWQPIYDLAQIANPETASGVRIGPETALGYHAWYRAISLISQKCAAVPKHVYRRTPGDQDGKERARDHFAYGLVHERANSEQTAFQFWLQMAGHVTSRGNGYAAIHRTAGQVELIPLDPDLTHPIRRNGEPWYVAFPFGYSGEGYKFKASEVLHFKGLGFDGLIGYAIWDIAKDEIGLGKAERKFTAKRYKNNARPAMVLQADIKMSDTAKTRLVNDWERMHRGIDNVDRTAVLDGGLKAQAISLSAKDMEQVGAAGLSLVAISNYTGVPSSKLGAGGKSYASQEQEDQAFINDGLDFYLNIFEDESGAKLFTDDERAAGYEVKANRAALLRPAILDQLSALRTATAGKPVMTQNEARKILDMPRSDEPDADKLLTPLNMGQGGSANQPNETDGNQPGRPSKDNGQTARQSAATRSMIEHVAGRLVRRVGFHANRLSARPKDFLEWLDKMKVEHADTFRDELRPCEVLAESVARDVPTRAGCDGFALDWLHARYADLVNRTAAKDLPAAVAKEAAGQEAFVPKTIAGRMLGEESHA